MRLSRHTEHQPVERCCSPLVFTKREQMRYWDTCFSYSLHHSDNERKNNSSYHLTTTKPEFPLNSVSRWEEFLAMRRKYTLTFITHFSHSVVTSLTHPLRLTKLRICSPRATAATMAGRPYPLGMLLHHFLIQSSLSSITSSIHHSSLHRTCCC